MSVLSDHPDQLTFGGSSFSSCSISCCSCRCWCCSRLCWFWICDHGESCHVFSCQARRHQSILRKLEVLLAMSKYTTCCNMLYLLQLINAFQSKWMQFTTATGWHVDAIAITPSNLLLLDRWLDLETIWFKLIACAITNIHLSSDFSWASLITQQHDCNDVYIYTYIYYIININHELLLLLIYINIIYTFIASGRSARMCIWEWLLRCASRLKSGSQAEFQCRTCDHPVLHGEC